MFRSALVILTALLATSSSEAVARRRLEDAQDFSWMSGYTVKFQQCFQDDDGADLVYFSLCPAENKCQSGCEGGVEYVADMATFVDAFSEAQLGAREYACEMIREECEANGQEEEDCYVDNYAYCADAEDEFDAQEFLQCGQWENQVENDDANEYFVGPTCYEGKIHLGYFTDEDCTALGGDDLFQTNNGYVLEYSPAAGYSIIEDECANCKEHGAQNDQNDADQEDEDDVLEQCEELYLASQNWENVADKYEDQVTDVRASKKVSTAQVVWITLGSVAAFLAIVGCCYYAFGRSKSNVDKSPLMSS